MARSITRESAQNYAPLLADFIGKTDALSAVVQTARRNKKSLRSHPTYAPKARIAFAELKDSFEELRSTHGDVSEDLNKHLNTVRETLQELDEAFPENSAIVNEGLKQIKLIASSDLHVALKKLGAEKPKVVKVDKEFIPNELLEDHEDVYKKILWEINVCFDKDCYNAAAILIRRLVESLLVLAFEANNIASRIKNANGDYMTLQGIIGQATSSPELKLTRNAKEALPKLKFFGDQGAHNPRVRVRKMDLEKAHESVRVAIEELAGHSKPKKMAS